jgi:hypothetical protein
MADDWAEREAKRFLEKQRTKQLQSEKELSDRKLKNDAQGLKWTQLRECLNGKIVELNKNARQEVLRWELKSDRSIGIGRMDNHTSYEVGIDPGTFRLSFTTASGSPMLQYTLEIKNGDETDFKNTHGLFEAVNEVAENVLSTILSM